MTVDRDQQAKAVDPQASLRAELLGQLVGAQLELQKIVAELARNGASTTLGDNQLQALAQLQRAVSVADLKSLIALRSEIGAAVTSSQTAVQEGRSVADNATAVSPAAAARQTISEIGHDYYDRKVLDPYLKFSSEEDEAAYRKRERENKEAYDREMAKGTLEGDRHATEIMQRQLQDAGAHGATASPEFAGLMAKTQQAKADLLGQAQTSATTDPAPSKSSARAADAQLDDVLATLKAAGVQTTETSVDNAHHGLSDQTRPMRTTDTEHRSP